MTVDELRAALAAFPGDMPVVISGPDGDYSWPSTVEVEEVRGDVGDPWGGDVTGYHGRFIGPLQRVVAVC